MHRAVRENAAAWGATGWALGVLALLVALPLAAGDRLPNRLATHWDTGSGRPDGSMPLWAATFFPALTWGVLTTMVALASWRARATSNAGARGWVGATLGSGGVMLLGGQAWVVRANLDHADWREADSLTGWLLMTLVAAAVVGVITVLAGRRRTAVMPTAERPTMEIAAGERYVWLSRTSNPWLHATAAVTGAMAMAAVAAALGGLMETEAALLAGPFALASVSTFGFSSVQARVSERGLKVTFGPLGWPARRWVTDDIASARVETRTPAQVGGWGYRLSGLGTTVMLRSGECLVIRTHTGKDFAVSVDDAERGAALLNSLKAHRST
ncbi:DUF1648 domain-containing protein [Streptomyces sp. NPDC019990]|uniref:DUF1648 domain-containing protein n=1 Tax=Streptomyces sp. NPDC019990 TaxID=3154693 RepID=UPI003403CDF3